MCTLSWKAALGACALTVQAGVSYAHSIGDIQATEATVWEAPLPANIQAQYPSPDAAVRHVIDQYKVWKTGTVLSVCFFGGDPQLRHFVAEAAQLWTGHGNLQIDFGEGANLRDCRPSQPSHIRVSFTPAGNWSFVGTDSVRTDLTSPSMNLGVANGVAFALVDKDELRGVTLHEFGHALGLQHEHQSPKAGCEVEIKWPAVYQRLGGPPNNWDKNTVDLNLRPLLVSARLRLSEYDRQSIMHYALPSWMFIRGQQSSCFIQPNHRLSPLDIADFGKAYPPTAKEQYVYLDSLDSGTREVLQERGVDDDLAKRVAASVVELLKGDFPQKSITVCARGGGVAVGTTVKNTEIATQTQADPGTVCPQGAGVVGSGGGVAIGGGVEGSRICTGGACPPAPKN